MRAYSLRRPEVHISSTGCATVNTAGERARGKRGGEHKRAGGRSATSGGCTMCAERRGLQPRQGSDTTRWNAVYCVLLRIILLLRIISRYNTVRDGPYRRRTAAEWCWARGPSRPACTHRAAKRRRNKLSLRPPSALAGRGAQAALQVSSPHLAKILVAPDGEAFAELLSVKRTQNQHKTNTKSTQTKHSIQTFSNPRFKALAPSTDGCFAYLLTARSRDVVGRRPQ